MSHVSACLTIIIVIILIAIIIIISSSSSISSSKVPERTPRDKVRPTGEGEADSGLTLFRARAVGDLQRWPDHPEGRNISR